MDNKSPENNGIGKKIRNIGMATVAAVTLGVGGKHVIEKQNVSNKESNLELINKKLSDTILSHKETKSDIVRYIGMNPLNSEDLRDFVKKSNLKYEQQARLILGANTRESQEMLFNSHLITDEFLKEILEEKYNNSLN